MMKSAETFPNLFSSGRIGPVKLKNRLVMLPMGTAYASQHGEVTEKTINYFVERAKGGVSLITLGNVSPHLPNIINQLTLDSDWVLMGHYELAEKIHAYGAKVCVQISHAGRQKIYPSLRSDEELISSSALASERFGCRYPTPRALEKDEIPLWVERYAQTAMRAKKVGYDMVEIHGAHGYLINQFISPYMNIRTDEYGGSLENRMRFPIEIIRMVRDSVGPDFPVGFRLGADEFLSGGVTIDESPIIAGMLEAAGIDYISVTAGIFESPDKMMCTMRATESWREPLWSAISEAVTIPTIAGGSLRHPSECERILVENKADFIGLGRPLIGDPEWPIKVKERRTEDIRFCISCNECARDSVRRRSGDRHCTVNATAGREKEFSETVPTKTPKKVMIVGAGPAGMEAARVAATRGHQVTIYEKETFLGGQLIHASRPQSKKRILWLRDYLENQLKKLGVSIISGKLVTHELVIKEQPEVLVLSTGAHPITLDIPGIQSKSVISYWDLLIGTISLHNHKVTVIGGGMIGTEVAEFLLESDNQVTVVEQLPDLAIDMEPNHRKQILELFQKQNITVLTGHEVIKIHEDHIILHDLEEDEDRTIDTERVVVAVGTKPSSKLIDALDGVIDETYVIGDCNKAGFIMEAIYEGSLVGRQI